MGEAKPLYVDLAEEVETAFGPKLCEALGIIPDPTIPLPDAVRGIIQRHRANLAKRGASTCTHTRVFIDGHFLEIITKTARADGRPFTVCGLSTEWETLTGERPCQHPTESN